MTRKEKKAIQRQKQQEAEISEASLRNLLLTLNRHLLSSLPLSSFSSLPSLLTLLDEYSKLVHPSTIKALQSVYITISDMKNIDETLFSKISSLYVEKDEYLHTNYYVENAIGRNDMKVITKAISLENSMASLYMKQKLRR